MTSYIIVTPDETKAKKRAEEICQSYAISQFDVSIVTGDKETSLGIELIKKLQEKIFLKPLKSKQKAVIIPQAQLLTIPAQNALLKLLEEPPEYTFIFLLTDNLDALVPTVQSRCQTIVVQTDERSFTSEEKEQLTKEINLWRNQDIGSALKIAEQLAKDKEKTITKVEEIIIFMREQMLQAVSNNHQRSLLAQQIRLLSDTIKTLRATNTNSRITLEYLLLSLRSNLT